MAGKTAGPLAITEAEAQVMERVWAGVEAGGEGAGVDGVLAALGPTNGWGEATVRTLIHRLIRKGALVSLRRGGVVVYAPKVRRADWVTAESRGFLDRLFGGAVAPLVAHLAAERALSPEDVARLRRLVAQLDRDAADEEG